MGRRVVLREIVCTVELSLCPVQVELVLGNSVFYPVVAHVEGLGAFHADLGFEDVMCCGVVCLQRGAGGGLRMTHFLECSDDGACFLGSVENASCFGFRGRCWDTANCFDEDMDWSVRDRIWRIVRGWIRKSEEGGTATAGIGENEVGCIGDHGEDHSAGMVANRGGRISSEIVKELIAGVTSFFLWELLVDLRFR